MSIFNIFKNKNQSEQIKSNEPVNSNDTIVLEKDNTFADSWMSLMASSDNPQAINEITYYTCLKILSEAISKLPLKILKSDGKGGNVEATDHPYYSTLKTRPNKQMSSTTFWSTIEYHRNHFGNAYVLISGIGDKMQLHILEPTKIRLIYDDASKLNNNKDIYYRYQANNKQLYFHAEQILHFKTSLSMNGIVGLSVKEQLASSIRGALDSQDMLNKAYKNGFVSKSVMQYTSDLSDANVKKMLKSLEMYADGKMDSKNLLPLPLGVSLQPLNTKLADNQFIELKRYSCLQIASAFGIKANQINDLTKSSYASTEAQQLAFYVDTLLFIIKHYEEELTYKLLSDKEIRDGYKIKFNVNVVLRADSKSQMEYLTKGVSNFILTSNDARKQLNLSSVEGGDVLIGNGSTIPIHLVGSQYTNVKGGGE